MEGYAKTVPPAVSSARPDATVSLYPVKFGTVDYAPIALELASKKPDALILLMVEGEFVSLVKELRLQGFRPQLYSWASLVSNSLVTLAGPGMEGVKSVSFVHPPSTNTPAIREFRDAMAKYAPPRKPITSRYFRSG